MTDPSQTHAADATQASSTDPPDAAESVVSTDKASDLQRERDDYYDRWVRKTAEFENYRKRIERERREQADQAIAEFLAGLLSVVDDFDRALKVDAGEGGASYRKGIELIYAKLTDMLRKYGVTPMEVIGVDFDPNLHQAVSTEPSAGHRDGQVVGELQRGYLLNGRLLRPAMVKVAKA